MKCQDSDEILAEAERYEREGQAALDAYDIAHPEDFLNGMIQAEEGS